MSTSDNTMSTGKARIEAVDALRGFALIGVGLVHALEQYTAAPLLPPITEVATAGTIDKVIAGFSFFLMTGKFYLIFSFLFGLSFFIQIDKPLRNDEPYSMRFAWRLVLLFLFGYAHHLIYRGDILMIYAVLGISLILLVRVSTKTLLIVAAAMFLGLGRYISFAVFGPPSAEFAPDSLANIAYFDVLQNGSFWEVISLNNFGGFGNLISFQFGIFARGYITFGLFLLGVCLGRSGIFTNLGAHRSNIVRTLKWSCAGAVVSAALMFTCFALIGDQPTFTSWLEAIALTFYDLFNLSIALIFSCGFLLLILSKEKITGIFAPYGRMALTNYILQSLIGAFFFYGWGLGLLGQWPNSYIILLGICIATVQILLSRFWMSHFQYGPLEWLWRTATLRRKVQLVRACSH